MNSETQKSTMYYFLAKRLIVIVGIFAAIISILMIANYAQTQSIDPLNSKAINALMMQLQNDPDNKELKDQIRALDLLARKAYFTNQWQIRTGSYLLFTSVVLVLLLLKYVSTFKEKYAHLYQEVQNEDSWESRLLARKYVVYSGLGLFILALITGIVSRNLFTSDSSMETANYASEEEFKQNWPGFRGPQGIGIAADGKYPTFWDGETGENIAWKIPLKVSGYNSPIIWNNQLFMSAANKKIQKVICIDASSGSILWETELNQIPGTPTKRPRVTKDTGYAASTMTTDGYFVYVIFATGDIACLDFNGKEIWSRNLGIPDNHYGHSSSLITYRNLLLVQYDHNESKQLFALNTQTGQEVYRIIRDVLISWASPILVNTGDRSELILNSNPDVISYNPENGKELWRVECMDAEVGPSPAYNRGMVYVVNEFARLAAISLDGKPEISWEYEDDLSEVSSPLATDEYLFVATSFGPVSCFDNKSGEVLWIQEFDDGFYSSPILAGGNVYLMDVQGVMHIFKPGNEFNLVNDARLGEKAMTIPAFYDGRIFIRGRKHLFCIAEPDV